MCAYVQNRTVMLALLGDNGRCRAAGRLKWLFVCDGCVRSQGIPCLPTITFGGNNDRKTCGKPACKSDMCVCVMMLEGRAEGGGAQALAPRQEKALRIRGVRPAEANETLEGLANAMRVARRDSFDDESGLAKDLQDCCFQGLPMSRLVGARAKRRFCRLRPCSEQQVR